MQLHSMKLDHDKDCTLLKNRVSGFYRILKAGSAHTSSENIKMYVMCCPLFRCSTPVSPYFVNFDMINQIKLYIVSDLQAIVTRTYALC